MLQFVRHEGVVRNFFLGGGINFYCTILQSYILTSSAAISAQNNFQGVIFFWEGIYTDIPPVATALSVTLFIVKCYYSIGIGRISYTKR